MPSPYPLIQEVKVNDKTTPHNATTATDFSIGAGPGHQLKIARENAQISVEQVAAYLHLTPAVVLDIERDCYDKGIPFTYLRGYMRTYARLVQISPDAIVKAFDVLGLEDKQRTVRMPLKSVKRPLRIQEGSVRWIFYVLIVVVFCGVIWWLNQPTIQTSPVQQDIIHLLNEMNPEKGHL